VSGSPAWVDLFHLFQEFGMSDLFDNPMGLCGFEFVEFASPQPGVLEPMFEKLGFTLVAKHRSKNVLLYRQGGINFIINNEPGQAAYFACRARAGGLRLGIQGA
jgi:4-hydroxyphenylpyruvate dioxygenase